MGLIVLGQVMHDAHKYSLCVVYRLNIRYEMHMLQEVAGDSLHVLMKNAFLECITAMAFLTVLMAVMSRIAVSLSLPCYYVKHNARA